jgi:hypothetical protein
VQPQSANLPPFSVMGQEPAPRAGGLKP